MCLSRQKVEGQGFLYHAFSTANLGVYSPYVATSITFVAQLAGGMTCQGAKIVVTDLDSLQWHAQMSVIAALPAICDINLEHMYKKGWLHRETGHWKSKVKKKNSNAPQFFACQRMRSAENTSETLVRWLWLCRIWSLYLQEQEMKCLAEPPCWFLFASFDENNWESMQVMIKPAKTLGSGAECSQWNGCRKLSRRVSSFVCFVYVHVLAHLNTAYLHQRGKNAQPWHSNEWNEPHCEKHTTVNYYTSRTTPNNAVAKRGLPHPPPSCRQNIQQK